MSEPTHPHEEPFNILAWPFMMPIMFGIFMSDCIVGGWVWTAVPEWRWMDYLIIGIDLLTLSVSDVMLCLLHTSDAADRRPCGTRVGCSYVKRPWR